jgi:hypothetical protein
LEDDHQKEQAASDGKLNVQPKTQGGHGGGGRYAAGGLTYGLGSLWHLSRIPRWSERPDSGQGTGTTSYRSILHANREKGMKILEMKKS